MFVTTPLRSILSIYPSNGVFLKHQSEFILNSKKSLNCKNFIRLSCVHPIFDDLRSFFFWKKRIQENVSQFEKNSIKPLSHRHARFLRRIISKVFYFFKQ